MNAGASTEPTPSAPALPAVYEAKRATDGSDAVIREAELTQAQAVAHRKTGGDIVVCGSDTPQNDRLAHDIEASVAGGNPIVYHGPHLGSAITAPLATKVSSAQRAQLPRNPCKESENLVVNYFTPERLVRLQDHSDERQFLAALDDWEQALEGYRHHLNDIQPKLCRILRQSPAFLRRFLKVLTTTSLHDASVLDMYSVGRSRFRITLHPESQPGRLLILTYSLTQPPRIKPHVLPEQLRSEPTTWLYDELTLEDWTGQEKPIYWHSILLSDGSEVELRFYYVAIEHPIPLVPAVSAGYDSR